VKALDPKTFQIQLKSPTGIMLAALGQPSGAAFIMPKKVAETDPFKQIDDYTGSGPFIFVKDQWKPGEKTVYVKNPKYKPRSEPASGLAGGKIAKVDRVEWVAIPDQQTAMNALIKGEIDMIESPQHDLFKVMEADPNLKLVNLNKWGNQYIFRYNFLYPPFDNAKARQALYYAFNQKDFLDGVIGNPKYYKVCKAMFMCDTPYASTKGFEDKLDSNFTKAKELVKESGYDGKPIILMHSTDLYVLANLAPVAKSLMEKAGFKVDMQSMDWQTLGQPSRQEGSAGQGRLERVHDLVGVGRHRRPAGQRLHQRGRRWRLVRLAEGRGAGQAACPVRRRARRDQAQGAGARHAGARRREPHAHLPRPVVPAGGTAQEHHRQPRIAGDDLLEHREEMTSRTGAIL
jgi:ABC-type transport system substrate-binding protein